MPTLDLKYQPLRNNLYTTAELYEGFSLLDAESMTKTTDFAIYLDYVKGGRASQSEYLHSMMMSLHDHTITGERDVLLQNKKCAAIMGGHKLARNDARYREVVEIGRKLAQAGVLIATGGGPGAMEAAHLGAGLCNRSEADLDRAIDELKEVPEFPHGTGNLVGPNGEVDLDVARKMFEWLSPAYEVWSVYRSVLAPSLAIPTWYYGHEPTTVFASDIAKYFQNSIREDGLLGIAQGGIIFAPGSAGTLQEIFQDAAQNYYLVFNAASPMVLYDRRFWEASGVPKVMEWLSKGNHQFKWCVADTVDEAVAAIAG